MVLAVTLGAFGAHGLKPILTESQLSTFETGNQYHFLHALAILIIASLSNLIPIKKLKYTFIFILVGIILFSGSLYLLSLRHLIGISHWKFLGPLTPIGGVFFLLGWASLTWAAFKQYRIRS